jgi:hypothetical protein
VQEHEKQLLEKLKAKLRAEAGPDSKQHLQVVEKLQHAIHDLKLPESVVEEAKKETLTGEDLLTLRKEMLAKVRDLEDELARLKISNKH